MPSTSTSASLVVLGASWVILGCARSSAEIEVANETSPYWLRALDEVRNNPAYARNRLSRETPVALIHRKIFRGRTDEKVVALTFDDGPHPKWTPQLLGILDKFNVRATFFVVGKLAEQYPLLVRDVQTAGHLIENHTYHHVNLKKLSDEDIRAEWLAASNVIEAITGKRPMFARPPGGNVDREVVDGAGDVGLTTILWTSAPKDYQKSDPKVLQDRILSRVANGGIILLHDGIPQTYAALPGIIETLRSRGFRFVTVRELVQELVESDKPCKPEPMLAKRLGT